MAGTASGADLIMRQAASARRARIWRSRLAIAAIYLVLAVGSIGILVPSYFIFVRLHWVDTLLPLIVPSWLGGGAFNIFLLRQFFLSIPNELGEAATIDGASILGVMFRIYVPLAKPAVAAIAIMTFIGTWHDFFGPLIYLNTEHHFTLALGINEYIQQVKGQTTHWNLVMAASMSIIVPPLILFVAFQRFFIEGIMLGGLKG